MKRLGLIMIAMLFIFPLVLTACEEGAPYEVMPTPIPAPAMPRPDKSGIEGPPVPEPSPIPQERIIVRNADMSLVVVEVTQARDEIEALSIGLGGWVVDSNIFGEGEEMRGRISIRIPSNKFEQALAELRALAVRVTSESTSTQDITEEYVDLESRLRNAAATESQYLALLEKAEDVEDILQIYEALSRIRYEIAQIKRRMQYLEQISAMSLISVNLAPEISLGPLVPPGWSTSETLNSAIRGLTTFGQGLGTALIWIGIFSPIWGTALGITYWRRRRRRKAQSSGSSRPSSSS